MATKTELTKEEKKEMIKYYGEGCQIGTSTEGHDDMLVEDTITEIYKLIGLSKPMIIWGESPVDCMKIKKNLEKKEKTDDEMKNEAVSECWFGQHEVYWIIFYRFCTEVLNVKYTSQDESKLYLWDTLAKNANWWYPYDKVCLISRKPQIVSIEAARSFEIDNEKAWDIYRLHSEQGPAVKFGDGFRLYSIHGVQVPGWLVETPAEELNANRLASITNAEIRREFVRKITVDRIYEQLGGRIVDKMVVETRDMNGNVLPIVYELVLLSFGDKQDRPYLKMTNPSTGAYHIEGVHPNCTTVKEAWSYRNYGIEAFPVQLT